MWVKIAAVLAVGALTVAISMLLGEQPYRAGQIAGATMVPFLFAPRKFYAFGRKSKSSAAPDRH